MSRVSVDEVLEVCKSTYRAIDLRVAILRDGNNWASAFAAVRLTWESVKNVRARHKELRLRHGTIKSEFFSIILAVQPFSKWKELCDNGAAGTLNLGGLEIELRAPFPTGSHANYLRRAQPPDGRFEELKWPSLEIVSGENPVAKLNADQVVRTLGSAGYESASQAISAICEVDTWPNSNYSHNFLLSMPIFTALSTTTIQPVERALRTTFLRHNKLRNLTLRALFADTFSGIPKNRTTMGVLSPAKSRPGIETVTGVMELQAEEYAGFVELSLSHDLLGELERQRHEVRSLLPAAERNLLLEVLRFFCPLKTLEEFITNPSAQRSCFKDDQSGWFEHHVAWLFSLFGFSAIVLGKQEHLKGERVQHGSIDVIAVREKTLLLVACTTGTPKEDFGNLWHMRNVLLQKLSAQTKLIILPVLVSGITSTKTYETIEDGAGAIPILDITRLRALTHRAFTGNANDLMQFLEHYILLPSAAGSAAPEF